MSDTAPARLVTRPGSDPQVEARARLGEAIAGLRDDQERFAAVEAGREKARRRRWELSTQVDDIKAELAAAEADEPQRVAYEFVNATDTDSPVKTVTAKLASAQASLDQIVAVESGLDREIEQLQFRLQRRHSALHESLAAVVITSPQFVDLIDRQLTEAWANLRGVRKAAWTIQQAMMGNMPREYEIRWQAPIPLDPTVRWPHGPIPTNESPAQAWAAALAALREDPETPLPGGAG
jgi:hypothetical protein